MAGAPDQDHLDLISAEIESFPALGAVKEVLERIATRLEVARRRAAKGLPADIMIGNMVFAGPAGTGKTVAAGLVGQYLATLGALADGHVVEVSRADLVGRWIAEAVQNTKAAFARARGGLLYIDDAFRLTSADSFDRYLGLEVISTLVKLMDDHQDDTIVILAGNVDEMKEFLAGNPGLQERFTYIIEFPGYNCADLIKVIEKMSVDRGYKLRHNAAVMLAQRYQEFLGSRLGNAHHARRTLDSVIERHASRVSRIGNASAEELTYLEAEDVPSALPPLAADSISAALPDRPAMLASLGTALGARSGQTGQPADLDTAIDHLQAAVDATPAGDPDRPAMLASLGTALGARSGQTGQPADLDTAIDHLQAAVDATPAGDPDRPAMLATLYFETCGVPELGHRS